MKKIMFMVMFGVLAFNFSGCSQKETIIYKGMSHYEYDRAISGSEEAQKRLSQE